MARNARLERATETGRNSGALVPTQCWLCQRELGKRIEWHHPVPRSRGGRATVAVHPICHRAIHASFSNRELEKIASTGSLLKDDPKLQPFLSWIAGKKPDFHAPTRTKR